MFFPDFVVSADRQRFVFTTLLFLSTSISKLQIHHVCICIIYAFFGGKVRVYLGITIDILPEPCNIFCLIKNAQEEPVEENEMLLYCHI